MNYRHYESIGEKVFSEKLTNGLTLFIVQKRGFSKKYAYFATRYGGADRHFKVGGSWLDTPEGVAHFLEHKMFDTKNGSALTALSENGASPNAYTSTDVTAYHFECIDKFYENLKILLSFVSVPYFTEESVSKEQGIIGQEIRMTEDGPGYAVYYNLLKCLYANHPLRYSVAGTVESIAQITPSVLYDCHRIFYNPSNIVLCIVGDVDPNKVLELTANTLSPIPGEIPERDYGDAEGPDAAYGSSEITMDVGMPIFMAGFKCGETGTGIDYLKKRLTAALAIGTFAGQSSPLYSRLYSDGLITRSFSGTFETVCGVGHVIFTDECRSPEKVCRTIVEEAGRIVRDGVDPELFRIVKKSRRGRLLRSLNSFDNICAELADCYFNGSDAFAKAEILDTIMINDITDFIGRYFTEERFAVSTVKPAETCTGE